MPNLTTGTIADILLVAGGGGGGSDMGGGGGGGGTTATSQYLTIGSYNITVGAGGSGAPAGASQVRGSNGTDSAIINTSTTATYSVMLQTAQSLTPGANVSFAYTGNFTVEGWIYRLATGDASMIVQGTSPYFGINVNAGTGINVYLNNATANLVVTDRVPAIQTWNHIALVRNNGIVKVYLNGVPSATTASNATTLGFSASNLYIGANNVTGGANQYISNVRITNGTALYTNTFTPSTIMLTTVTNTVLLACSSSTYTKDYSTSSASLIASGAIAGSPFSLLWNPFYPTFVTVGGGGGGSEYSAPTVSVASFGGSGGGAQSSSSAFGIGITGQGYSGVASIGNYYASGGGGATSVGVSAATGNAGGTGLSSSILGTTYYWGGGGGGSGYSNLSGNGGAGGGGGGAPLSGGSVSGTGGGYGNTQGINPGADAQAGTLVATTNKAGGNGGTNTGGGGGGGSHINATNAGGTGGSGAVVIRYTGPPRGTGGTIYSYTSGSTLYTAHAFFSSDTFTLYPIPVYPQASGGTGGPYGGGGGGAGNWYGQAGGMGAAGSASSNSGYPVSGGGGSGGGVSTTSASGGGGGVDVYGITSATSYMVTGGAAGNPGLGGSLFNLGGRPGTGGNGGLYGGGGSGATVASVDTNTGNGAGGALLIIYNTTASTYAYPSIMPVLSNSVNTGSTVLLTVSSTTNKLLLTQFDNIVTSYQNLGYSTLATGNSTNYGNTDVNVPKISQSQSIVAANLPITTYIIDHEMMLKNSDPQLPAAYNTPGNYQFIQEITPTNDPRLISVRVQNYVVGVTGSDSSLTTAVTAGGQVWF